MSKKLKGKAHIHAVDPRQMSFQFGDPLDPSKAVCSVSNRGRDREPKQARREQAPQRRRSA